MAINLPVEVLRKLLPDLRKQAARLESEIGQLRDQAKAKSQRLEGILVGIREAEESIQRAEAAGQPHQDVVGDKALVTTVRATQAISDVLMDAREPLSTDQVSEELARRGYGFRRSTVATLLSRRSDLFEWLGKGQYRLAMPEGDDSIPVSGSNQEDTHA